jgi:predicted amidohydrolase YtcJ
MISRRDVLLTGAVLGANLALGGRRTLATQLLPDTFNQDLLIVNARALTLDPKQREAEAIIVRGGRISFVGKAAEAKARGRRLPLFDAAGRTVVPGFIDGHTHLEWFSESFSFHTQLSRDLKSLQEMFTILRAAAAKTPAGRWVLGRGTFSVDTQVVEKRLPTRQEMDSVSTDHPVILFSSVHEASLNTLAFKRLSLWSEQDQLALKWTDGTPRVGSIVQRDSSRIPTGVCTEIFDLILNQPLFTLADRSAAYGLHAREDFVPKGITSIVNMSGLPEHVGADQSAQDRGELPLRIRMFHMVPCSDSLDRILTSRTTAGAGDNMYRFGGIKVFVDGDGQDGIGHEITDLKWTQDQLNQTVLRSQRAGYPMVFHVVTKGGFDLTLNSLENAQRHVPRRLRHQIHHLGGLLANSTDRARVKALQVTLGLTRADRGGEWPEDIDYRGLLDEGIPSLCVSDSAGSFRHFSTLEGIASLVAPPSEGGVLKAGRTLTFEEALRMWTTTPAYANYEEPDKGSITVGKLGDLTILSRDPRNLEGGELFDVGVDTVILGGRVVFRKSAA